MKGDGKLVIDEAEGTAVDGADGFKPMDHHEHAVVMTAWLKFMRQVHAGNSGVLRDFDRLEQRILHFARRYSGFGYQRYLRTVRQRLAHVADLASTVGVQVRLGFGDFDPDLFMEVFQGTEPALGSKDNTKRRAEEVAESPNPGSKSKRVCNRYNQRGRCSYGEKCRFAHVCAECGDNHPARDHGADDAGEAGDEAGKATTGPG